MQLCEQIRSPLVVPVKSVNTVRGVRPRHPGVGIACRVDPATLMLSIGEVGKSEPTFESQLESHQLFEGADAALH